MKPTIYDIARRAGVSIATVSHALNNTGRVGPTTRQNVLRVVQDLGYQRNAVASALAGKNSYSIALIVPDVNNAFFSELLRGAEDEAFKFGYSVLICNTDHDVVKEQAYLKTLRSKSMDGIIIATGSTPSNVVEELVEEGVAITILSREIPNVSTATVLVDNFLGGSLAAQHLSDLGHRSIGVITEPLAIGSSRERLRGFESVFTTAHPSGQLHVSRDSGFGVHTGFRLAWEMLSSHPVTAIFAANDQLAVGALQACIQLGKRVPEDISLVGFDNTILAQIVQPPLTTVAQPMYELGQKTVSLTIDSIESGQQSTETVVLMPELVVRQSTCAVRL